MKHKHRWGRWWEGRGSKRKDCIRESRQCLDCRRKQYRNYVTDDEFFAQLARTTK